MSDKNIDYQMYLDYLDGKSSEPKPEEPHNGANDESPIGAGAARTSIPVPETPVRQERPLSKLEEIERKYHLDHDGEEKGVHLMTDDEFAAKYGSKNAYKKQRRHAEPVEEPEPEHEEAYEPEPQVNDGYEDVYSYDADKAQTLPEGEDNDVAEEDGDGGKGKKGGKGGKGKKKKWWKILVAVLAVLVVLGGVAFAFRGPIEDFVVSHILGGTKTAKEDTNVLKQLEKGDDKNHGDMFYETSAGETYSLEGWLDSWQKAEGQLMYNDKIVNVLLIGMDDPEGDEYGRSDAMILVSIDTINQKLKLTSVWRDTYGLIQIPKVEGKHEAYEAHEKINGANYYGGPELTVKTIESLYKVRIDGYVMTTFESFKDLIDAMGGINVDVEQYEDEFLQEEAQYSWHATYGKDVLLNGSEALVYSRIRHLDSDIKRTERQRKVMSAMLEKIDELSTTQLFKTVNSYLDKGYVSTNFSQKDIGGLGKKAVFGGWKDFEMEQMTAPISSDVDPENSKYYWGGTYNGAWVWVVDVPKTATDVQKFIYDETYCQLNENRHSISEFVSGGIH
ncbi:MAG: LytR family transcriptional regulator [Ruminococcaceae bacterium]|nr:LytR family transcriptional regulator [Oscillospiraceae bacterium]